MRIAVLLLALLTLSSCDLFTRSGFSVNLINQDSQPIHLLTPGEAFGPDNRLSARGENGDSRFVNFPNGEVDDLVVFRAGANGVEFTRVSCAHGVTAPENANVYYRPSGILECEGWNR